MARSTGKFISYDLRPAKQSERLILVDVLKAASDSGLPIREYRYVGMGANRFYDFLLVHRYLGITDMVSLEHDAGFYERAKFNSPYSFIRVENLSAGEFIDNDPAEVSSIYWLDYDGGIGPGVVSDISAYAEKTKLGDFIFATVSGNPPRAIDTSSDADRLVWLQDNIGDLAEKLTIEDVEKSAFSSAVFKILSNAFRNAFAARKDGAFVPLLQVGYSDSMPMITIGGAFLAHGQAVAVCANVAKSLPFLSPGKVERYEIRSLHITERERALLDVAVTAKSKKTSQRNKLKTLGFRDSEINSYSELLRYIPRYVETIV